MLDEAEWPEMHDALSNGIRNIQTYRVRTGANVHEATTPERLRLHYAEAVDLYERLTGVRETVPLAIWHHRLSLYGPPCPTCGKPYRTPQAKLCAACGHRRTSWDWLHALVRKARRWASGS